jgi:hypothetical protein
MTIYLMIVFFFSNNLLVIINYTLLNIDLENFSISARVESEEEERIAG